MVFHLNHCFGECVFLISTYLWVSQILATDNKFHLLLSWYILVQDFISLWSSTLYILRVLRLWGRYVFFLSLGIVFADVCKIEPVYSFVQVFCFLVWSSLVVIIIESLIDFFNCCLLLVFPFNSVNFVLFILLFDRYMYDYNYYTFLIDWPFYY